MSAKRATPSRQIARPRPGGAAQTLPSAKRAVQGPTPVAERSRAPGKKAKKASKAATAAAPKKKKVSAAKQRASAAEQPRTKTGGRSVALAPAKAPKAKRVKETPPGIKKARAVAAALPEKRPSSKKSTPVPCIESARANKRTAKPTPGSAASAAKAAAKKSARKAPEPKVRPAKTARPAKREATVASRTKPEAKGPSLRLADPKTPTPEVTRKKALAEIQSPVKATPAPRARAESKEKKMDQSAKPAAEQPAKKAVVRIARGLRTPKHTRSDAVAAPTQPNAEPRSDRLDRPQGGHSPGHRMPSPKIEVNPRLQSSKHLVKNGPKVETTSGGKPMSVAQKNRAAAEAIFARLTVPGETKPEPTPAPAETAAAPVNGAAPAEPAPLPYAARKQEEGGGSFTMRVSERDTLTTGLRLASTPHEALGAATELANRYQLPPDQSLLLKVIELGDERLTKLALEEMLELEDRGRVRATPELKSTLGALQSRDPETVELRQLLLEKIGAA